MGGGVGEARIEPRLPDALRGPAATRGETADLAVVPPRTAEIWALAGADEFEPCVPPLLVAGERVLVVGVAIESGRRSVYVKNTFDRRRPNERA